MREEQQITAMMVVVFIIGLAGLFLMGGVPGIASNSAYLGKTNAVYIDDYRADLYLNGTLDEHFKYNSDISLLGKVSRLWAYPLSFQKLDKPYIEAAIHGPLQGAVPYLENWLGDVKIVMEDGSEIIFPHEMGYTTDIASLAMTNEEGCYKPERFNAGSKEISYIFKMHPPIEQDEQYCHWNLLLADEHLPYGNVNIKVNDPQGYIVQLFPHPKMAAKKVDDGWVITGSSQKDALLEVEMLLKADAAKLMDGFPRNVSDVANKTISANRDFSMSSSVPPAVGSSSADGIAIKNYNADIYLNGTVQERFLYDIFVSGQYRMLYRAWRTPLSTERLSEPYAEPIKILAPEGTVPYVKDYEGKVRILAPNGTFYSDKVYNLWPIVTAIKAASSINEAGYYIKGDLKTLKASPDVDYRFVIHPSIQSDNKNSQISLNLGDKHLPYNHFTITIHDLEGKVSQVFTRPKMDISKDSQGWTISGNSIQNQPLEINFLMSSEASGLMGGFVQPSQDVEGQFLKAASDFFWKDTAATILSIAMRLLMLLAPLMLLWVYRRYGKERFFVVPSVLAYVPNNRKPWQVNLVFKGDPFDFDKDGFYATILNLQRQNLVEIQSDDLGGLRIKLIKGPVAVEDGYERKVMNFLSNNAVNDILDTKDFESKIEMLRGRAEDDSKAAMDSLHAIRDDMNELMAGPGNETAHEFFVNYSTASTMLVALPIALIFATGVLFTTLGDTYPQLAFGFYSSVVLLVQSSIPAFAIPKAFFGKWKQDYYKEKLEWDAFKRFLSDFATIQRYAPEDISIWKDWLVYGTALGAGDKVVKAMEQLKIPALPEAQAVVYAPTYFGHIHDRSSEYVITKSERDALARQSSGGGGFHSGGGGGFGGGGGHGGGGGGAR